MTALPDLVCGLAGGNDCWSIAATSIDAGEIRPTILAMVANIVEASQAPEIRTAAIAAAGGLQGTAALDRIFRWIQSHVAYMSDAEAALPIGNWTPQPVELILSPLDLLAMAIPYDKQVTLAFVKGMNLMEHPSTMMRPGIVARVLLRTWQMRQRKAATQQPLPHQARNVAGL